MMNIAGGGEALVMQSTLTIVPSEEGVPAGIGASHPSEFLLQLLRDQQDLSSVDRFARWHSDGAGVSDLKSYSALMPAGLPREGEQYAFEVDLDACSGCKSCVTACHSLNGLDECETWREVGLLHGGTTELPVMQHVTAACHHCLNPACMSGCPVQAYEKDPVTGIVRHIDDQCIGCQYCILACPYDVPKYNSRLGIVRKCDMCSSRLAAGEAPACAQACPNGAIRIKVVRHDEVTESCETGLFLPGAPEPGITLPTTNYKTQRALPRNLLPADYYSINPEHAHLPLVVMLVLTQLSVGAFVVAVVLQALVRPDMLAEVSRVHAVSAFVFGLVALCASLFHLGRPHLAFRAVIGLRSSWLSREIIAFGAFAGLAALYASVTWVEPQWSLLAPLGWAVAATGMLGVVCSIMIYRTTQRRFWSGSATSLKFLLSSVVLGVATALVTSFVTVVLTPVLQLREVMSEYGMSLVTVLLASSGAKLLFEAAAFWHLHSKQNSPAKRSALLMTGPLRCATSCRFACGSIGGLVLPTILVVGGLAFDEPNINPALVAGILLASFVACTIGEFLERYLYFTAVVPARMPGRLRT